MNMKRFFLSLLVAAYGGTLAMAEAGTVSGTISANPAGKPAKIRITKDAWVCGKKEPLVKEGLRVSKSGGLANAVVEIIGAGKSIPEKVQVVQENCRFVPHVVVIPSASSVVVNNRDGIMHNFHSFAFKNDTVNFAQPGDMKTKTVKGENFQFPEVVQIKCDIHEWMLFWALVTESAYVAVTDANGNFSIPGVPPGNYRVKIWHETLGEKDQDIKVKGGTTAFNFEMAN